MVDELDIKEGEIQALTQQSSFDASQEVLLAPPQKPGEQSQSKAKMFLLLGIGIFILLMTLMVLGSPRKTITTLAPTPSPSSTPNVQSNAMKQITEQLQTKVKESNPDDVLNSPPQVDMTIEF